MIPNATTGLRLSVVVAAWNGTVPLGQCLASLEKQIVDSSDTEIIVVSNDGGKARQMIDEQYSFVKYIPLAKDKTVPQLRAQGICRASGEIVALLEDHCTFDENWCAEIKRAHELPYSIVGGSVENASCERLLDWAVYFYDYGRYMLPNRAGVVTALSGANVSYKRSVLVEIADDFRKGFFEAFIHAELQRRGHELYLMPSAIMYHNKTYVMKDALIDCYHLARSFAGRRIFNASLSRRAALVLASLSLPILLPARIAAGILRKRRHVKELIMSFPHLTLLIMSWSWGEFCGYLRGEGASAEKWK